jgi:hypothetical protein
MKNKQKSVIEYIESIPDDKLSDFQSSCSNVHRNVHFRLDTEGVSRRATINLLLPYLLSAP